ncbi:hypothetical protein MRX96_004862 [Rhipicephalus microplus]
MNIFPGGRLPGHSTLNEFFSASKRGHNYLAKPASERSPRVCNRQRVAPVAAEQRAVSAGNSSNALLWSPLRYRSTGSRGAGSSKGFERVHASSCAGTQRVLPNGVGQPHHCSVSGGPFPLWHAFEPHRWRNTCLLVRADVFVG